MSRPGRPLLRQPIIILGCNRSGTTLLFNNLSAHPETWSLYIESQDIFYRHHPIDPDMGDRVTDPPDQDEEQDIERYFYAHGHNKEFFKDTAALGRISRKLLQRPVNPLYKRAPLRLVEKTPANTLRIPYLAALFPDAKWLFLVRRGEDVVSSLMEGWKNWSRTGDTPWN
ncbi:MAG: sulfotransferase family protein, partial [Gemmatimonadales bacterium]